MLQGAIQVTVTINGSSITIDKENFINLKVKRLIGDTANSFTLEAFDETAYALEGLLQKNEELAPILVQYSASTSLKDVITFSGTCMNYQISFVGKATLISIEGIFSGGTSGSSQYWFEQANIEWVGEERYNNEHQQWEVDGKGSTEGLTDELYTDYINNENVCAILQWEDDVPGSTINYDYKGEVESETLLLSGIDANYVDGVFTNTTKEGASMINSDNVESLRGRVTARCQQLGIGKYLPVVMAILRQESGGANPANLPDMFQCSESLGLPRNSITLDESIKQGPAYYKECLEACNYNYLTALQAYNFGVPFATWAYKKHGNALFDESWCKEYKDETKNLSKNAGDDKYVEHVKRFYRVKAASELKNVPGVEVVTRYETQDASDVVVAYGSDQKPRVFYNPARIFKRIINMYAGKTGSSPNKKYENYFKLGKVVDTQWVEGLPRIQMNETAAEYIKKLCSYSMTVDTDENGNSLYGKNYLLQSTGYQYYVDSNGHNFTPIDFSNSARNATKLTYGTKDSIIISFSSGDVGKLAMTGNLYDENTGALLVDEAILDEFSADVFTIGGENVMGSDVSEETKKESITYKNWWEYKISPNNISSTVSKTGFEKKVGSTWSQLSLLTNTAEMTVWGGKNSKLIPGSFVDLVIYGNGLEHYSSGLYFITSIEDNISADGYTQTCRLIKNPGNLETTATSESVDAYIDSQGRVTFKTTTKYSNGHSITTETPATELEAQYYFDIRYADGWQDNYPAQQKAKERLKTDMYNSIEQAKKNAMKYN